MTHPPVHNAAHHVTSSTAAPRLLVDPSRRWSLLRWLISMTRDLHGPLWLAVGCRLLAQTATVIIWILACRTVLSAAAEHRFPPRSLVVLLTVLILAKATLRYAEQYAGHFVAFRALQRLRDRFIAALIPRTPAVTATVGRAKLTQQATSDIDRIEVIFAHTLPPAITAILLPIGVCLTVGLCCSWPLAFAVAVPSLFTLVVIPVFTTPLSWTQATAVAAARSATSRHIADTLAGAGLLGQYGTVSHRLAETRVILHRQAEATRRLGWISALQLGANQFSNLTGIGIIIVTGITTGATSEALVTTLVAFIALWTPMKAVTEFAGSLDEGFAATARLATTMQSPLPPSPTTPAQQPFTTSSQTSQSAARQAVFTLTDVGFTYPSTDTAAGSTPTAEPTLTGITTTIACGHTAIVGVSGSGKSTLARLLVAGIQPTCGTITYQGQPLSSIDPQLLRKHVCLLSQRDTLITGTLRDNIALRNPAATDTEIRQALTAVALDSWVDSLDAGLDTILGDEHTPVSGGQTSRIIIARAFVDNPEVVILDEALRGIDTSTARTILARILQRFPTVIDITHRVDLIADNTQVRQLDAGTLVASGTADTLLHTNHWYQQLAAIT
ncbi:amino acid ABC transporter ATP-binding/permease protein [Corynebacterium choanae]|uniref:Putative multidrug resistance ABC transporter ATP-binding/permease protein YheI n=1 Tax=Corynebacterium choanae TaxID=1862358 RepID=A0A3G6J6S0_9CORY|nr:ABC transporter ATP-binding protein [Corynebacterium choanae]AZA13805.1 putative multidrug resistance ABC transporter ATP-binding/permease protein YheI [Corynebacterium choanae]